MNCNSNIIKMTKRGNIIIDFIYNEELIEQIKIENFPFEFSFNNIEELWDEVRKNWNSRKNQDYEEDEGIYTANIKEGTLSIFNKETKK